MTDKKITKIQLPIEDDKVTPAKPDMWWWLKMLLLAVSFFVVWYGLFYWFAHIVASDISLEQEREYFWNLYIEEDAVEFDFSTLSSYSWSLWDPYRVYVQSMNQANAFATPGGNIIFTTQLLEELEYEEEFLFILGHEKEHIDKRHVLKWLLTHIPFQVALASLGFEFDTSFIADKAGKLFDKQLEIEADDGWIAFLNEIWANLECATWFFERESGDFIDTYFQLDSSHPIMVRRLWNIRSAAEKSWNTGDCTPLDVSKYVWE